MGILYWCVAWLSVYANHVSPAGGVFGCDWCVGWVVESLHHHCLLGTELLRVPRPLQGTMYKVCCTDHTEQDQWTLLITQLFLDKEGNTHTTLHKLILKTVYILTF